MYLLNGNFMPTVVMESLNGFGGKVLFHIQFVLCVGVS